MEEQQRKRRRPKQERVEGRGFMDVAREGFVRHVALDKWREIEDMRETLGFDWVRAVQEAGQFLGRGGYRSLWLRRWDEQVVPHAPEGEAGSLFAAIEKAVAAAVHDEDEARKSRGDRPLDEDPEFKAFTDASLEKFFRETAGEMEPG